MRPGAGRGPLGQATQWRNRKGLRIDNTLSFSVLDQGGYPYAHVGEEIVHDGQVVIRKGRSATTIPARRTTVGDGLTVRATTPKIAVSSITLPILDDAVIRDPISRPELFHAQTGTPGAHRHRGRGVPLTRRAPLRLARIYRRGDGPPLR